MNAISVIGDTGTYRLPADDEEKLEGALFYYGPVTVVFNIFSDFLSYTSGIYSNKKCDTTYSF